MIDDLEFLFYLQLLNASEREQVYDVMSSLHTHHRLNYDRMIGPAFKPDLTSTMRRMAQLTATERRIIVRYLYRRLRSAAGETLRRTRHKQSDR